MRQVLFRNFLWKAGSLVAAVILWLFLVAEPELVQSHTSPVFLKNLPRQFEVASDVPDSVHLELQGGAGKLSSSRMNETAVIIDLSDVREPGERTFTIAPGIVNLSPGVRLLRAVPSQLRVRFDRVASKEVAVQVRTTGVAPDEIVRQEVVPPRLKILGPDKNVQQIEAAQTDPIDLSQVNGQAHYSVHAYVPDPQVRFETSPAVTFLLFGSSAIIDKTHSCKDSFLGQTESAVWPESTRWIRRRYSRLARR